MSPFQNYFAYKKFASYLTVHNNFMTTKCHVPRVKMNRLYFVLTSLATRVPSATTERRHPMIVEDIILFCGILTNKSSNWLDLDLIELSVPNNSSFYTKIPHAIIELFQEKMIPLYGACPSVLIVIIKCKKKRNNRKTGWITSDTSQMSIVHPTL